MHIPLTKPYWGRPEVKAVTRALETTSGTGDGPFNRKLEGILRNLTGASHILPVTSCTHGMELAIAALVGTGRLKAGDEVIMPSFTMTSTANAVVLKGVIPRFCDIEDSYYCIDPRDIRRRITRKTRGIMVVHYAGMPCRMTEITRIAKSHRLFIIEDAAHAVGAYYKNQALGTMSDIGVFSFHGTKNVTCGEGGAVLTDNKKLADFMDIYKANGTNRKAFLEGAVDKYSWVGEGTSFFLSDLLAALAYTQLKQLDIINKKRAEIARKFTYELKKYSDTVIFPEVPPDTSPNWHIYALRFKTVPARDAFVSHMRSHGIEVSTHYVPLHTSVMGQKIDPKLKLPVTERVASTLVRLPIYPGLTELQLKYIISQAKAFLQKLK